jgi:hypothetical protein
MVQLAGRLVTLSTLILGLAACGTTVPRIQALTDSRETGVLVDDIVKHVQCEIQSAVQLVILEDMDIAEARKSHPNLRQGRSIPWLDSWLADVIITLTVEEKSSINPGLTLTSPMESVLSRFGNGLTLTTPQSFSFGLGATGSADATRKDTLSWLIDFKQLSTREALDRARSARDAARRAAGGAIPNDVILGCEKGTSLIEGDLEFRDWLRGTLLPAFGDDVDVGDYASALKAEAKASKKAVIGHEITFVILFNGNVTPSWKLLRVSANQGNTPFLNAQRTRTQDLQITMGPRQDATDASGNPVPSQPVLNSSLAGQIGLAVANAVRSTQ